MHQSPVGRGVGESKLMLNQPKRVEIVLSSPELGNNNCDNNYNILRQNKHLSGKKFGSKRIWFRKYFRSWKRVWKSLYDTFWLHRNIRCRGISYKVLKKIWCFTFLQLGQDFARITVFQYKLLSCFLVKLSSPSGQ